MAESLNQEPIEETPAFHQESDFSAMGYEGDSGMHEHPVAPSTTGIPLRSSAYSDGVGKYMAPEENTLTNHYALVRDPSNELDFLPGDCPLDTVSAYTFKDPAFSKPTHPHYLDYRPLRENIAVVRNVILQNITESADLSDPQQNSAAINTLDFMGLEIGEALQRGSRLSLRGDNLNPLEASQPGIGAAEIYQLLYEKQESNKSLHFVKKLFGKDYSQWNLPPIEDTIFNAANVEAFRNASATVPAPPAPAESPAKTAEPQAVRNPVAGFAPTQGLDSGRQLAVLGSTLAGTVMSLDRVRQLPKPVRDESIDLARKILENLRFSMGEAAPRDAWMQRPESEVIEESNALVSVAGFYADVYNNAQAVSPEVTADETLQKANEALGKLAYLVKSQSIEQLEAQGNTQAVQLLQQEVGRFPESWKDIGEMRMGDLLAQLNTGLERAQQVIEQAKAEGVSPEALNNIAAIQSAATSAPPAQNPALLAAALDAQLLQQFNAQQQSITVPANLPDSLKHLSPQALAALQQVQGNSAASARVSNATNQDVSAQQSHVEALGRGVNSVPAQASASPAPQEKTTTAPVATPDYRSTVTAQQNTTATHEPAKSR